MAQRDPDPPDAADAAVYAYAQAVGTGKVLTPGAKRAIARAQRQATFEGIYERTKAMQMQAAQPVRVITPLPDGLPTHDDAVMTETLEQLKAQQVAREQEIVTHIMGKSELDKIKEEVHRLRAELRQETVLRQAAEEKLIKFTDEEEQLIRRIAAKTQVMHGDQASLLQAFLVWLLGERGIEFHQSRLVRMQGVTEELREEAGKLAVDFAAALKALTDGE